MTHGPLNPSSVLERLDRLVAAGRITEDEAGRVRTAAQSGDLEEVVAEIRLRHSRARVAARGDGDG